MLFAFMSDLGLSGIMSYLIPSILSVAVLIFYFISGIAPFISSWVQASNTLICVALVMQAVHLSVFGFQFNNNFFPLASVGVNSHNPDVFVVDFRLFTYALDNGFNPNDNKFLFTVNLIPTILIYFLQNRRVDGVEA